MIDKQKTKTKSMLYLEIIIHFCIKKIQINFFTRKIGKMYFFLIF